MKLNINFSGLHMCVRAMGAKQRGFVIADSSSGIDPIDTKLKTGIIVRLEDIEVNDIGLLSYKGRQVLLYIQDQGFRITEVLNKTKIGSRYHVAYCRTLDEMQKKGRFERYVVKNDISGIFHVIGTDKDSKESIIGEAELKVCKNCLDHLDYKNYRNENKANIFNSFSQGEFFETYKSYFKQKPSRTAGVEGDDAYSKDWESISYSIREASNWECVDCGVNLEENKTLLHTHHINGVKSDNRRRNLLALCLECHGKQPDHQHMYMPGNQLRELRVLRASQGIANL